MMKLNPEILANIKQKLLDMPNLSTGNTLTFDLRNNIAQLANQELIKHDLSIRQRNEYIENIYNAITGMDILQPLMNDDSITEIMVNSRTDIFIEQHGQLKKVNIVFDNQNHLQEVVTGIFARANKELTQSHPITDLRLTDGSRANAILPPIAPHGPILTIRKFTGIMPAPASLISSKTLSQSALDFLAECIVAKKSIFICGGTGAGKTTLLNALSTFIPNDERIITIEDSAELQLRNQPNLVTLEARSGNDQGQGEISIASLIKTALRMRPDRIIVGEVRGDEAYMLIHAANTGHPGTLCTGHGNNNQDMLIRLANIISGCTRLPYPAILRNLITSINIMVHIIRLNNGQRRIAEIAEVKSLQGENISLNPLFQYNYRRDELEKIN